MTCEICGGSLDRGAFTNAANEVVCLGCFRSFIPTEGANLPRLPQDRPYA